VSCSLLINIFLLSVFFFYKFNRHLCHSVYWCTHNPAHMPRLLPICIFISHLPPTSRTLMLASNIHTYLNTSFCPFYTNLLFPYVFSYVYVYVCTCARMHVRVYLWIPCILFVFVPYVYSFFPTGLYICVWRTASCVFYCIFTTTFVFRNETNK